MDVAALEGHVVRTPWGLRTIRIISVATTGAREPATIRYSFIEDPAVKYSLIITPEVLLSHPEEVQTLVSEWTGNGHPNGSSQPLSLDAIDAVRRAKPPVSTSHPGTGS